MRWVAGVCALLIGASVSGCTIIEAELSNRGGFLDHLADDHWMKADSKKMRALRAVAIEASLARIAMITPKSAPDRASLARKIGDTTVRADLVRRCAFLELRITGQRADEPCFFFDSVMVDYENALFDLALVALPIDEARNLLTRVAGGAGAVSLNPLQLVQALLDIGREAFRYGRVVGAIYRDTLELEVQVWLTSPEFAEAELARGVPERFVVTYEKVAALRTAYVRGNDNIPAWRGAIANLRAQELEPVPHQRFIAEIFAVLTYICGQVVNTTDPTYKECARPDLTKNIPMTIGMSRGVSAREQETIQTLQRQARLQEEEKKSLQKTIDDLKKQPPIRLGALSVFEQGIKPTDLKGYKQALCVRGADATSDTIDMETRQRLRDFINGVAWERKAPGNGLPQINEERERKLKEAITISRSCDADADPSRHAYELGVYARDGKAAAETVITRALGAVGLPATLRGREAIQDLRKKFEQQPGQSATSAQAATAPTRPHDQLDPALWGFIQDKGPRPRSAPIPQPVQR